MNNYEKNYFNLHPQNSCLTCGKCCHITALKLTPEELFNLAEKGDLFAKEFLENFRPYDTSKAAPEMTSEWIDDILLKNKNGKSLDENITLYHCKYLRGDKSCEKRDAGTICKNFSVYPWAIIPQGCELAGMLFLKREEEKQRIRKAKEELIDLAVLKTKIKNKETLERIESVEKKLNKTIELYREYGADDW